MDEKLKQAFITGVERVAAWSDLLDEINVYPVADGDTGRNLSMSLTPLRFAGGDKDEIVRKLLLSARGNSCCAGDGGDGLFAPWWVLAQYCGARFISMNAHIIAIDCNGQ